MGAAVGISSVTQSGDVTSVVGVPAWGVWVTVGSSVLTMSGSGVGLLPSPVVMVVMAEVVTTGVVWSVIRISSDDSSEDWLSEDSLDADDSSDWSDSEDESS